MRGSANLGWLGILVVALFAACGDSGPTTVGEDPATTTAAADPPVETSPADPAPVAADPKTYVVGVDGSTDEFVGMFLGFFPEHITVHAGDTIVFRRPDNGEPHTVTFELDNRITAGTPPGGAFFRGGFGGLPRADASMPCVLAEGSPPAEGCSPDERELVPFDGTHSWYSSGALLGEEEFVLTLADDIAPGTYTFLCLVHVDEMRGTLEVVEASEPADDPAEVLARGADELESVVDMARGWVEQPLTLPEGTVRNDRPFQNFKSWALFFRPGEIEIRVGDTVTWAGTHFHTISFNAPESARPFYERAEDGSIRENDVARTAVGDPEGWDGIGFFNSGMVTFEERFSVTFTRPGTYAYLCLIHFDMEGRVTVID